MAPIDGQKAFKAELERLLRAQIPLIHINSFEEERVLETCLDVTKDMNRHALIWSTARGVFNPNVASGHKGESLPMADLVAALQAFEQSMDNAMAAEDGMIFVLLDPYPYLSDRNSNPIYRRRLREFSGAIRTKAWKASCIIVAPSLNVPYELEREVTVVDFPLPTRKEIRSYVRHFVDQVEKSDRIELGDPAPLLVERLTEAAIGLSHRELENALAYAAIDDLTLDTADVQQMFRQKRQTIRKSGLLEFIDNENLALDLVGGLDRLKRWLGRRRATLTAAGSEFGLEPPKGVLLTGVPGCGKSLSAKCVAASWQLPLIRLDMGRVFSSLVGASEEHMRHAISVAEAVSPCVLWIDEIEKGLMRPGQHVGDSGVSMRVLGTFLTWMQEKQTPVFVVATANEIFHLPPEILRKGRFDGVFFVDLPTPTERREIIDIHMARVGRTGDGVNVKALLTLSGGAPGAGGAGMTGAEIAAWIDDAMLLAYERYADGGDATLGMADFETALEEMTLLAQVRADELVGLRRWGAEHAQLASTAPAHGG